MVKLSPETRGGAMRIKVIAGAVVAVLLSLALVLLLEDPLRAVVRKMDRHEGVSGWFQAVFSVIAIMASTWIAVLIPREQRRLEKRDQCVHALSVAAITLKHTRKMLARVRDEIKVRTLAVDFARTVRQELEGRLDDLSAIQFYALPQSLSDEVYELRAQVRIYCVAFADIETGQLSGADLRLDVLQGALVWLARVELACREELAKHSPRTASRRIELLEDRVTRTPGFMSSTAPNDRLR